MCLSLALHVAWPLLAMPNKPNGDPVLLLREPRLVGAETHSPVGNPQETLIISLPGVVLQDDSASPRRWEPNTRRCSGVLRLLLPSPACSSQLSLAPSPNYHSMHAMCVRHSCSTHRGPVAEEQPAEYSASTTLTQHAA